MRRRFSICITLCLIAVVLAKGQFTTDLPIIVIQTEGEIVDEPKVNGSFSWYMMDTSREAYLSEKIGIELRGNTSFHFFPKKGFGFEFRDGQLRDKDVSIFGWPEGSGFVIHSPYSDKSLVRNALAYTLGFQIMPYAPRCELIELIINQEYYGVCLLTEKISRSKGRISIKKPGEKDLSGGYIFKIDKGPKEEVVWTSKVSNHPSKEIFSEVRLHEPRTDQIRMSQLNYIQTLFQNLDDITSSRLFADIDVGYRSMIDVISLIDFILINELAKNMDAYRISTYFYKNKNDINQRLYFGPIWDYNIAWGNTNYCKGSEIQGWAYDYPEVCPQGSIRPHFWWKRWLQDPVLQNGIKKRWIDLRSDILNLERVDSKLDSLTGLLQEAQERNFNKWPVLGKYIWPNSFIGKSYQEEIDYLSSWIRQRILWMDEALNTLEYNVVQDTAKLLFEIVPNPSKGDFFFYFSNPETTKSIRLEFFDSKGGFYEEIGIRNMGESDIITWSPPLKPGIYYVKIWKAHHLIAVKKLVKT